jgi:hypothetical protein
MLRGNAGSRELEAEIEIDHVFELGDSVAVSFDDPSEAVFFRVIDVSEVTADGYVVVSVEPGQPGSEQHHLENAAGDATS